MFMSNIFLRINKPFKRLLISVVLTLIYALLTVNESLRGKLKLYLD